MSRPSALEAGLFARDWQRHAPRCECGSVDVATTEWASGAGFEHHCRSCCKTWGRRKSKPGSLALVTFCLLAFAARLPAEPPTGPYLLAVATASRATGINGPQLGVLAGGRARVSDSIALLFEVSALHSPKLDAGDGYLLSAMFDVEHWRGRWYGALGASYAIQMTSVYSKEAWAPRLTIGRQGPAVRLSGTWQLPDSTPNRTTSLNLVAEWRSGRAVLRIAAGWLWHRDGDGWRLSVASGLDLRRKHDRMHP